MPPKLVFIALLTRSERSTINIPAGHAPIKSITES